MALETEKLSCESKHAALFQENCGPGCLINGLLCLLCILLALFDRLL